MEDTQQIGARAESRFLAICRMRTTWTPDWFVKVKRASTAWDVRGVDAFVYFTPKDGSKDVKVPVQIKSSRRGRKKFLQGPADKVENILLIRVTVSMTDDQIRRQLYSELGRLRNQEKRFEEFLIRTINSPLSYHAHKNIRPLVIAQRNLRA